MALEAYAAVHEALSELLGDGEIAVGWCLSIDIAGPDGSRYLAHRAGGGVDGTEAPTVWAALGMLQAAVAVAERQLLDSTSDVEDADDDGD